jgi:UDP-N-acetylmuramoyl-L-alanyl-D-glutamate--2,6-diaminopimelate ligase
LKKAVLNLDDEFGQRLKREVKWATIRGYSRGRSSTVNDSTIAAMLLASSTTEQGLRIQARYGEHAFDIQTFLIGDFNIDNLLACLTVLNEMNIPVGDIESAMQGLMPIPGRMEFFPAKHNVPGVVIDFAHTEQALEACLEAVRGSITGRLFCVFGCGGDRDQGKRARMAAVAEARCDAVVLTDDNPRSEAPESIMKDILDGFERPEQVRVIHDRETAIETALNQASSNDLVVIAGKGHEQFQLVGDQRIPFSDRHVVRQIRGDVE